MDTFRTFIAIELPPEARAPVLEHIAQMRRGLPDVRASWSRESNLHLTLKFLGNVPVNFVTKVSGAVAAATKDVTSFEMTISGNGSFPARGRPSVLWLGTQAASLQALHDSIDCELAAAGFPRESRAFHPHLTIARLRVSEGATRLAELHRSLPFTPVTFTVSEIAVFKSELLSHGSKHTAISRHTLRLT